jgi:hypothetical protein
VHGLRVSHMAPIDKDFIDETVSDLKLDGKWKKRLLDTIVIIAGGVAQALLWSDFDPEFGMGNIRTMQSTMKLHGCTTSPKKCGSFLEAARTTYAGLYTVAEGQLAMAQFAAEFGRFDDSSNSNLTMRERCTNHLHKRTFLLR